MMKKVLLAAVAMIAAFSVQAMPVMEADDEVADVETVTKAKAKPKIKTKEVNGQLIEYPSPRAVGFRFSTGVGLTYQHQVRPRGMVSVDLDYLAIGRKGGDIAVTYDFLNPFRSFIKWNRKGTWNWYLGVGLSGGIYESCVFGGVAGRLGIEYDLAIPLQIALEWRPTFGTRFHEQLKEYYWQGLVTGVGVCVRYKF